MAFTREQLADYEKGPQRKVPDTKNPFEGAKPAGVADPAAIAAVKAGEIDATPGGAAAAATTATVADDAPVVDEDGTLGDPTDSGEGTSDAAADSSTATDDPGVVADPNADLTGEQDEEPATSAPAKGSAQERIVELNDRLEGAMVYGRSMQETVKAQAEELARLRAGGSPAASAPAAVTPPVEDEPGAMPDMADPDIAFDDAKYRAKMQEWSAKTARHEARKIIREVTGATQANQLVTEVNAKVEAFAKTKPDFAEVVTNNRVLKDNQLAPDAGLAVARSPYTAELLYKFGKDPGYAIRVAKMSPADQLLVVGEMVAEIKLERKAAGATTATTSTPSKQSTPAPRSGAQPAAQRKSTTNAPPPPRPTSGAGSAVRRDPLDPNMSVEEFARLHRAAKQTSREQNRKLRGL